MSWDAKDADEKFKDLSARGITYQKLNGRSELPLKRRKAVNRREVNSSY
jgi:hypothetical protein